MPNLKYYKHEDFPWFPVHSEWSPTENTIYVRSDDPMVSPHIAISHELGHWKGAAGVGEVGTDIGNELNAWEDSIYNLMRGGEWTPEVKKQVEEALETYFKEYSMNIDNPGKETRWWIKRLEDRARRRLRCAR